MFSSPKAFWGLQKSTPRWNFTNTFPPQSYLDRWCAFVSYQLSQTIASCSQPSRGIEMLALFGGEQSIIPDLETDPPFLGVKSKKVKSVWASHAKLLQLRLEIISLPHKLALLTSDESEPLSMSNRMSLVHKHPVKPTAGQNYLRWTKSVFVSPPTL